MNKKPILYIDVDGVLFAHYSGHVQLRPNVVGFLRWCMKYFECKWMTVWPKGRLDALFNLMYAHDIADGIPEIDWRKFGEKDDSIDLTEDFYWIEDGPVRPKLEGLVDERGMTRYIEVDTESEQELELIKIKLRFRMERRMLAAKGRMG